MDIESFRYYCLQKSGVTEGFPFNETTLVFKVGDKMFALTDINEEFGIALKCDPEFSIELRERFSDITPAYHMNKTHWINVNNAGFFDEQLLIKLIDHSHKLVFDKLAKAIKNGILNSQ